MHLPLDQKQVRNYFDRGAGQRPMLPDERTVGGWGKLAKYRAAVAAIRQTRARRVLDLGCNIGHITYLHRLDEPPADTYIVGSDISFSALQRAGRENSEDDFDLADGTNLPYAADSFDLIVCIEMIEHVPDQVRLLGELYRVLQPGGQLLITTPNVHCWPSLASHYLHKAALWLRGRPEVEKDQFLNRRQLLMLLDNAGFKTDSRDCYFLPRPFLLFRRWILTPPLPPRLGVPYQKLWVDYWGMRGQRLPLALRDRLYHTLSIRASKPRQGNGGRDIPPADVRIAQLQGNGHAVRQPLPALQ